MKIFQLQLSMVQRLCLLLVVCCYSHQAAAETDTPLPGLVSNIMQQYRLPLSSLSLYIKEHHAKAPLVAINIDTPRNPASAIKLLTTYAALDLLGPTYTWQTKVYLDGQLANGHLDGNLMIQGGGDPRLSIETFWQLLLTMRNRGLKHIDGDLIIDDTQFEQETGSPADFDNRPHRLYNVLPHAALLNFNAYHFHFIPMTDHVHIYTDPPSTTITIDNKLQLTAGTCNRRNIKFNVDNHAGGTQIEFTGRYPKSCGNYHLLRAISPPDDYLFGVFKALWETLGGTISGDLVKAKVTSTRPFYILPSKPLSQIIADINKYSNNVMSRQLFLTLSKMTTDDKANKALARTVIADWLGDIGIVAPELILDNGSGLSRQTQISARTMVMMLEHAKNSPYQAEFLASIPMLGVDGNLKKRQHKKIPAGNIRIKTGLINNVRAMAGYVISKTNKHYIIVALQNHHGIHNTTGTIIQNKLLQWLYDNH